MTDRFSPAFAGPDEVHAAHAGVLERELAPVPSPRFSPAERPAEGAAGAVHAPLLAAEPAPSDGERLVRSGS